MNLIIVTGRPFTVTCSGCGQRRTAGGVGTEPAPVFADIDGEPFKSYYCEPCAQARGVDNSVLRGGAVGPQGARGGVQPDCPAEFQFCSRCREHAGFQQEDGRWVSECCGYGPITTGE